MIPFVSLAKVAGIPAPMNTGIIDIFTAFYKTDFWKTGLTLDRIGLADMTVEEIKKSVTEE